LVPCGIVGTQTLRPTLPIPKCLQMNTFRQKECGRRLGVSDQTIRNWIAIGRKNADKGWVEGIHYVNVSPDVHKKAVLRIPWNRLIQSFAKNENINLKNLRAQYHLYHATKEVLE